MNIGDKVISPKFGEVIVTGKKHKELGNKIVWVGIDKLQQEHELTGNEPLLVEVESKVKEIKGQTKAQEKHVKTIKGKEKKIEKLVNKINSDDIKVEVKNFPEGEKLSGLLKDLKKAVKAIPKPEHVDYTAKLEALQNTAKGIEKWQMDTIDAIKNIPETEVKDHSRELKAIEEAVKGKKTDLSPITTLLSQIARKELDLSGLNDIVARVGELEESIVQKLEDVKFEIPSKLIHKDQIKVSVDRVGSGGSGGSSAVKLQDKNGADIDVQNPLPADGDSIYAKDVNQTTSTAGTFTGAVTDLFNEIGAELVDSSSTNPKTFTVKLHRPIDTSVFRVCSKTGNFSNVKIILKDASNAVVGTIDDSSNNTNYTSNEYVTSPVPFCQMVWEFHTTDAVKIDFVSVSKSIHTHSIIQALKPDGTATFIDATAGGNLKVSIEETEPDAVKDPFLEIARGNVTGQSKVNKFGAAPDFDTGDNAVTVWDGAEDGATYEKMVYTYSTTADITHIVSDSASDTEPIEVQGLDTNGDLVVQSKTLTGTTAVALDTPLKRVFRMKNTGSNALVGHAYTIVSDTISAANVRAMIQIGNEQTEMAIYTVPTGKTAYLKKIYASSTGASRSTNYDVKLKARKPGGVFQLKHHTAITDGSPYDYEWGVPNGGFSAGTDIEVTAQITAAAITGAAVIAGFDLILIDN